MISNDLFTFGDHFILCVQPIKGAERKLMNYSSRNLDDTIKLTT
jgi:hypothetical protein